MSAPEPKAVLDLAERIVEVEEELASLREQWEKLFAPNGVPQATPARKGRPVREGTLSDRVFKVLESNPQSTYTAPQVAAVIEESDTAAVGRALYKLYSGGKIRNISRGLYAVKEVTTS